MYVLDHEDDILELVEAVAVVHATEEDLAQLGRFEDQELGARDFLVSFDFNAWKPRKPPGLWHGPITYLSRDEDMRDIPVALWFKLPGVQ